MGHEETKLKIGDIQVNCLGYGAMRLTGAGVWGDVPDRSAAIKLLKEAVALGINFIDTADAYGPHTNETLIADALYPYPKDVLIATKGGLMRSGPSQWSPNGNPAHIKSAIDGSLKRLKRDHLDLWQLHRIDPAFPVEETLGPVSDAIKAGKIRYAGLSEVGIKDLERAQKTVPIVSVQNMYNLSERKWEEVLDYTAGQGLAFIPWYPLASGPDKLKNKVDEIASKYKATAAQIALAWLLKRSPNILLIPGTGSVEHLKENRQAADIKLSQDDFNILSGN